MSLLDIDPANWEQLNRLLDECLELPPADRETWLNTLSPEFDTLKPTIFRLLERAAQVDTGDFLRTLPPLALSFEQLGEPSKSGERLGPYRLVRELGSGGMGSVWLAERTDGMVNRPVALKLPHQLFSAGFNERMVREREILATLEHPNIARLYDAGVTGEGQPYLALEYIEGVPINEYCDRCALDTKGRLRTFLQVAEAVAYAHSKLIVHRDLKPENILVNDDGQVGLLDFGIAKILEGGQAAETQLTRLSGRALTPDYASPEQVAGAPVTTSSDVYSLGVLLYELLAGSRPYKLKRDSAGALEDAILATDPARPSETAKSNAARRALRGDLDTIILKALKKEPADRYATVHALVEDIQRHLGGRPLLARPDTPWYTVRKFVGRNKLAVGAATAVLTAVLVGAGFSLWQARIAFAEKERAEEVKEFIASIFRNADPYADQGKALTAIDLLKQAKDKIDATFGARPETKVELLTIVGGSLTNLEDYETAEVIATQAIAEAGRTLGDHHPRTLDARVLMLEIHRFRGRTEELREALAELLPELRTNPAAFPTNLVTAVHNQAHLAIDEGRYGDAGAAAKEAFELAVARMGERHPDTIAIAITLALSYQYTDEPWLALQVAESVYRLTLDIHQSNLKHPRVIDARALYGGALAGAGRLEDAIEQMDQAVSDASELFGPSSVMVGFFSGQLARHRLEAGDILLSLEDIDRSLRILTDLSGPDSFSYAAAMYLRGAGFLAARRSHEALSDLTLAAEKLEQTLGPKHTRTYAAGINRALALGMTGETSQAEQEMELLVGQHDAPGSAAIDRPRYSFGVLKRIAGDYSEAMSLQRAALETIKAGPKAQLDRMLVLAEIGLNHIELGRPDHAAPLLEEALALFESLQKRVTPAHADALVGLGRARMSLGKADEAVLLLREADEFWRGFDAENRWAGEAALWLGRSYALLGRAEDAKNALARAKEILSRSPIPSDAELIENLDHNT